MSKKKPSVDRTLLARLRHFAEARDMFPLPREVQKQLTDHVNAGKRRRRRTS